MSDLDQDFKQDLFNLILENPQYEISSNSPTSSFIEKLQTSYSQLCTLCKRQIHKILIYYKDAVHCVGCFCKQYREGQPYATVDLSKKIYDESRWTVFEQLQIVNEFSIAGVQSCPEVANNIRIPGATALLIQEYRNAFLQHKQEDNKNDKDIKKIELWKKIYQQFTNSFLFNEYQVVDYMLGQMHEKSNPEIQKFLISYKQSEDQQRNKILKQIQKLAKDYPKRSENPHEIQYFDEDISMSDLQIENSIDEQEFRQKSIRLIKDADELIKRKMQKIENRRGITSSPTQETDLPAYKHHMIKKQTRILQRSSDSALKQSPKRIKRRLDIKTQ